MLKIRLHFRAQKINLCISCYSEFEWFQIWLCVNVNLLDEKKKFKKCHLWLNWVSDISEPAYIWIPPAAVFQIKFIFDNTLWLWTQLNRGHILSLHETFNLKKERKNHILMYIFKRKKMPKIDEYSIKKYNRINKFVLFILLSFQIRQTECVEQTQHKRNK